MFESFDLTSPLVDILNKADADQTTNIFLLVIVSIFIFVTLLGVLGLWKRLTDYAASLLTSVGILGTFTGVVIGLMNFDPTNIDGSIELLLNGLKTAFITSLAGMAAAIVFKIISSSFLFISNRSGKTNSEVEAKDFLTALDGQKEAILDLKNAICGEEESTLIGKLRLFKEDVNDNHKASAKAFDSYQESLLAKIDDVAEAVSQTASEQLIEILKETITDFNKNLT